MSPETEREAPKPGESLTLSSGQRTFRASHATISGVLPVPRWASAWWLIFLGLAVAEVVALTVRVSRVPPNSDWTAAASLVRAQFDSHDAITVAPSWADPLLRLHLGDRIHAKVAGRPDLAAFERLWVLSIRGQHAHDAPARDADFTQVFGRVKVERFDFGPSPVVLDFVDELPNAAVAYTSRGATRDCSWQERVQGPFRGGLGAGPMPPRQRFVCNPKSPSSWVGTTVLEDLSLAPKRCIFQHPQGPEPTSVTYRDVHLGTQLVLHAGLDYHRERHERGAPVTLRVFIHDKEVASFVHHDGEGFKRYEVDTRAVRSQALSARGNVRFEVTTPNPKDRVFCWAGSIRDSVRAETP